MTKSLKTSKSVLKERKESDRRNKTYHNKRYRPSTSKDKRVWRRYRKQSSASNGFHDLLDKMKNYNTNMDKPEELIDKQKKGLNDSLEFSDI
mmetsp:Transcript_4950/g.4198  ORF Transcript_4950/g.4198 Transcript_4950/m.4198 type:complete len:92 (+) Transcript_4950:1136-1411(+)